MDAHDNLELVRSYTADQSAAIRHILEAIERQVDDDTVQSHPTVHDALLRTKTVLEKQREDLTLHLERELGSEGLAGAAKNIVTTATGFVTGLYAAVRNDTVSKMVRDDCTALNFACICYSMLYATATAFNLQKTATVATTHLHELTPLVIELNKLLPKVVVDELAEKGHDVEQRAVRAAIDEIGDAWSHRHTGEGRVSSAVYAR